MMMFDRWFRSRRSVTTNTAPTLSNLSFLTPLNDGVSDINQYNALNSSAVYACIRILSETLAQLPLVIRRRTADGSELASDHPLFHVLNANPNPWMSSFTWRTTSQGHCVSWGNGYSLIVRDMKNDPKYILPLLPDCTSPQIIDNRLTYWTQIGNMSVEVQKEDIIHVQALSHDGILGMSPIAMHREAIGLSQSAQSFGAKLFANGSLLSGVLTHPGRLKRSADKPDDPSPVERLRKQWRDLYSGLDNAGQVAILEEGMDFKSIGIPPEDAQFLQTRKFQIADIARIFNVPSHMVNDLERSTFNNISEMSISFLRYNMMPWFIRWEQELTRKLFPRDPYSSEKETYYVKFNMAGLLRGTLAERADYYKTAIEYGWLSRNEVREMEDLNQVDGLDQYLQPLNMGSGTNQGGDNGDI